MMVAWTSGRCEGGKKRLNLGLNLFVLNLGSEGRKESMLISRFLAGAAGWCH